MKRKEAPGFSRGEDVTTNDTGRKLEQLAEEILRIRGAETYRPPKGKYIRQDMFGCDIMAKFPMQPWVFYQVGTASNLTNKKNQVEAGMKHILRPLNSRSNGNESLDQHTRASVLSYGTYGREVKHRGFDTWHYDGMMWAKGMFINTEEIEERLWNEGKRKASTTTR